MDRLLLQVIVDEDVDHVISLEEALDQVPRALDVEGRGPRGYVVVGLDLEREANI